MSADTIQNIKVTGQLFMLHNSIVVILLVMILYGFYSCWRTPRRSMLLLIGASILSLFLFEYQKHFFDPLFLQTLNSLVTMRPSSNIESKLYFVMKKVIPSVIFMTASLFYVGSFLLHRNEKEKSRNH